MGINPWIWSIYHIPYYPNFALTSTAGSNRSNPFPPTRMLSTPTSKYTSTMKCWENVGWWGSKWFLTSPYQLPPKVPGLSTANVLGNCCLESWIVGEDLTQQHPAGWCHQGARHGAPCHQRYWAWHASSWLAKSTMDGQSEPLSMARMFLLVLEYRKPSSLACNSTSTPSGTPIVSQKTWHCFAYRVYGSAPEPRQAVEPWTIPISLFKNGPQWPFS